MTNSYTRSIFAFALALLFASSFSMAELKTSSLSMNKNTLNGQTNRHTLSDQCQKLFQEGEKLVREAEKQPGTHTQVKQMKDKLQLSKKTISAMDLTMQQKSCDKGLIALNNLKQKY